METYKCDSTTNCTYRTVVLYMLCSGCEQLYTIYLCGEPGEMTFSEAFFANQQVLLHTLHSKYGDTSGQTSQDGREREGLLHDRDNVAFYGDPSRTLRRRETLGTISNDCMHAEEICRIWGQGYIQ